MNELFNISGIGSFPADCEDYFNSITVYYHNELLTMLLIILILSAFLVFFTFFRKRYPDFYEKNIFTYTAGYSLIVAVIMLYLTK